MRELPDLPLSIAYCPLMGYDALQRHEDPPQFVQTTCDRVDCMRCAFMTRLLRRYPDARWVCWECADSYVVHVGFWTAGTCSRCGSEGNIVRQLVEEHPEMVLAVRRMHEAVVEHIWEED